MDLGVFRIPLYFFLYGPIAVLALLIIPTMGSLDIHILYRYLGSSQPRNPLHLIASHVCRVNTNLEAAHATRIRDFVELYRKGRGRGNMAQDRA